MELHKVYFANDKNKYIYLTDYQLNCVIRGLYIKSGLDLDTYMGLKSNKWPTT